MRSAITTGAIQAGSTTRLMPMPSTVAISTPSMAHGSVKRSRTSEDELQHTCDDQEADDKNDGYDPADNLEQIISPVQWEERETAYAAPARSVISDRRCR